MLGAVHVSPAPEPEAEAEAEAALPAAEAAAAEAPVIGHHTELGSSASAASSTCAE